MDYRPMNFYNVCHILAYESVATLGNYRFTCSFYVTVNFEFSNKKNDIPI